MSLVEQTVQLNGTTFSFREGEHIVTEHSYKYSVDEFAKLAGRSRSFWTLRPGSERKGQWAPTPLRYSFVSVKLSVLILTSRQ